MDNLLKEVSSFTTAHRHCVVGTVLLSVTVVSFWLLADMVVNRNIVESQAAVLVVIVIGWCCLVIGAMSMMKKVEN